MPVRNVSGRDLLKRASHGCNLLPVPDDPYPVPDPILCHKIIDRLLFFYPFHNPLNRIILSVSQENRACVGIGGIHMADAVDLFILPCIFVLFDDAL